jgi:hypothetical protein
MNVSELTPEQLGAIGAALAKAMAKNPKGRRNKARKTGVSRSSVPVEERKAIFADAVKAAFAEAGYGDVIPNEDVLSYGKWEERGFRVRKGEKAVRVKDKLHRRGKGLPLFHHTQVEKIPA